MDREGTAEDVDLDIERTTDELSVEEKKLVDALVVRIITFVNELNIITKPIAKIAAKRLVEKLRLASLPEGSVGTIAQGVWAKLKNASDVAGETCSEAEPRIVEDIMHKIDGPISKFINSSREKGMASIDPAMNGRVIRAAAAIAWPRVRAKLGV